MLRNKKYFFVLNVDFEKLESNEFLNSTFEAVNKNESEFLNNDKITKITELEILNSPKTISFLDEFKTLRKCSVSMIDFRSKYIHGTSCPYKCFWDRCQIPPHYKSIGCPIKYIPSRAIKTYDSFISKEKYSITEKITESKRRELELENKELKIEPNGYYETDGIFCSFNCCLAFLQARGNNKNAIYKNSKNLLLQIYNDVSGADSKNKKNGTFEEIIPAAHWRTLIDFGGFLSIEEFRGAFNKTKYIDRGSVLVKTYGRLFEEQIRL